MKIYESVPNISEGRDLDKINQLLDVIRSVDDVRILDFSSDVDHNRSVFTFIGTEDGIIEANMNLMSKACEILNINEHSGIHPRMGIVDVMPIIPVWGCEISDAVKISHKLGKKIEENLDIPVYFYGYAASTPKERNLADIRRKGYNDKPHKTAGVVCVSARDFLVAYNVNLKSKNLDSAKKIAVQVIREAQKLSEDIDHKIGMLKTTKDENVAEPKRN